MKRLLCLVVAVAAAQALVSGQAGDVNKILADARAALGGERKLAGLKTFAASGQSTRVSGETSSAPTDVEVAIELPDKYMRKDVVAQMMNMTITRTSGFNGEAPISIIDQPPAMGGTMIVRMGPGGPPPGVAPTPEQEAKAKQQQLLSARQDFVRFTLAVLLASPAVYPLEFKSGGQAESPDGKADIVEVTGEGGFAARLFIDAQTHLPLMLSWMAKEPLVMRTVAGPGGASTTFGAAGAAPPAGGGSSTVVRREGVAGAPPSTPEEREKMMAQLEQQRKEAEAKARTVEYRLYYGDYRGVDGIQVPFRIQRAIDGKPVEETTLDKVKINGKIDAKKFDVAK
jgi:hypothetical protein